METTLGKWVDRMGSEEKKLATEILALGMYVTNTPFTMVCNPIMKLLFKKLKPSFTLPTPYMLAGPLLDRWYNKVNMLL